MGDGVIWWWWWWWFSLFWCQESHLSLQDGLEAKAQVKRVMKFLQLLCEGHYSDMVRETISFIISSSIIIIIIIIINPMI